MKKFFYLLVMFSSVLWSCSKGNGEVDDPTNPDDPDNVKEVYLEVNLSDLVFEAQGGEKKFRIGCYALDQRGNAVEYGWTLTGGDEWCRTDVTEGSGWTEVTVTADAYTGLEDRNTNLTIKAGEKSFVLTVTQKHGDAIVLSKDKFDVPEEGGEVTVEVKSNIQYEVSIPYQFQRWIKQAPASKAVTEKKFTFTISENDTYETREGYIVFKGNSLKDTVYVYQIADPRTLILTQDSYHVSSEGETIEVELKTNIDYNVTIPYAASEWISRIQTKATRTDKILLEIAENAGYDNRSAEIIIQDRNSFSGVNDTLYISQSQQNALILGEKKYNLHAGGGQISIEVKSNIDYEAVIPAAAQSWIQKVPDSKGLTTSVLAYNILANPSENSRSAEIVIKDKNNLLSDTVYVSQGGKGIYVGDLVFETEQDLIDFHAAEYTKIIGTLTIKGSELKTLQKLDNLLAEIDGTLIFDCSSLTSLDGLDRLKKITEDLIIKSGAMSSLNGLGGLEIIGRDFRITDKNGSLYALTSLGGLSSLKSIDGDFELNATCNNYYYSLSDFSSFEGLESLEEIGGHFKVNASSSSSSSFSSSSSLSSLTSFKGLSGLKRIGGDFELIATTTTSSVYPSSSKALLNFSSFKGLESLEEIGGHFKVNASSSSSSSIGASSVSSSLSSLTSFNGLSGLKRIGGDFELIATTTSSSSYNGASFSEALLNFSSFEGLESLEEIGGHFKVNASSSSKPSYKSSESSSLSSLTSFNGLGGLKKIGGDFELIATTTSSSLDKLSSFSLDKLSSFEGLENLEEIMGKKLTITNCKYLDNIDALSKVRALDEISITGCSDLYDFCILKNVVQNMNGTFYVNENGYNPTKYQLLNGVCSKTPGE